MLVVIVQFGVFTLKVYFPFFSFFCPFSFSLEMTFIVKDKMARMGYYTWHISPLGVSNRKSHYSYNVSTILN